MVRDDETGEGQLPEPETAPETPRRSTFTPPLGTPAASPPTDDDALADALAAETVRITSGPIGIITPDMLRPPEEPVAEQAEQVEQVADAEQSAQPEPEQSTEPEPEPDPEPSPEPEPEPEPSSFVAEEPAPTPTPSLWSTLPAPDPAQAVPMPEPAVSDPTVPLSTGSIPVPPVRMSLPDEELSRWVEEAGDQPGGTLDLIEKLQDQLRLREEEAAEFRAWEDRMRTLGTPDAMNAVEDVRPQFDDVLPHPSGAVAASAPFIPEPAEPSEPEPEHEAERPEPEQSEPEQPEPEPAQGLPEWNVPAPSATWSPDEWVHDEAPTAEVPIPEPSAAEPSAPEPSASEPALPEPALPEAEALAQAPAPEPETRAPFDWTLAPEPLVEPAPPAGRPTVPVAEPVATPEADHSADEPEPEAEHEAGEPAVLPAVEPKTGPATVKSEAPAPPPLIEPAIDEGVRAFDWSNPAVPDRTQAPPQDGFDDLLAEAPPERTESDAASDIPEMLFIEPMPVSAGEPIPTDTGTISVIDQAYEEELDDDVDETDRAFAGILGPVAVDATGSAAVAQQIAPPSGPISTVRIREDEQVIFDDEPVRQPIFSIEDSDVEPTPVDHRVGRAARMFWLWFAANSTFLSVGLGAAVFAIGLSLRQSIVAILAGVAVSFLPLGLSTLAGKRSGQPTMIVSRASFGLIGNLVPAVVALVSRLFWGAVLLWLLASSVAVVIVGARLDGSLGERQILLISLAVAFLIAVLIAFAGYPMIALIQLVLSIISGILVVGLIALTYQYIDIPQALTVADGPWMLAVTGAVLVFSFVGLVWANSGADLARYQRTDSSGASNMLWATFGTAVPSFLLIGYGALLAASDQGIASGFLLSPLDTLALMLPSWYPVPLIAATTLSLLSGIILSLYSGGFALQSIGVRVKRQWSIVIVGVLLGGLSLLLGFGVTGGLNELLRDAATTLAVPTAAWAGIFAAETMIRNRRFEPLSLVRRGGVYADVRWVNLVGLVLITVIGFGLTTATVSWLGWQGYGFSLLGVPLDSDLAGTDIGVFAALLLGLLLPIVAGIPAIRKQEAARAPE